MKSLYFFRCARVMEVVRETVDTRGFSEDYIHDILYHSEVPKKDRNIVELYLSLRKAYHGQSLFQYLYLLGSFRDDMKVIPAHYYIARVLRMPINIKNMKVQVLSDGSVELPAKRYLLLCLIIIVKFIAIGIVINDHSLEEVLSDDDVMASLIFCCTESFFSYKNCPDFTWFFPRS